MLCCIDSASKLKFGIWTFSSRTTATVLFQSELFYLNCQCCVDMGGGTTASFRCFVPPVSSLLSSKLFTYNLCKYWTIKIMFKFYNRMANWFLSTRQLSIGLLTYTGQSWQTMCHNKSKSETSLCRTYNCQKIVLLSWWHFHPLPWGHVYKFPMQKGSTRQQYILTVSLNQSSGFKTTSRCTELQT